MPDVSGHRDRLQHCYGVPAPGRQPVLGIPIHGGFAPPSVVDTCRAGLRFVWPWALENWFVGSLIDALAFESNLGNAPEALDRGLRRSSLYDLA